MSSNEKTFSVHEAGWSYGIPGYSGSGLTFKVDRFVGQGGAQPCKSSRVACGPGNACAECDGPPCGNGPDPHSTAEAETTADAAAVPRGYVKIAGSFTVAAPNTLQAASDSEAESTLQTALKDAPHFLGELKETTGGYGPIAIFDGSAPFNLTAEMSAYIQWHRRQPNKTDAATVKAIADAIAKAIADAAVKTSADATTVNAIADAATVNAIADATVKVIADATVKATADVVYHAYKVTEPPAAFADLQDKVIVVPVPPIHPLPAQATAKAS